MIAVKSSGIQSVSRSLFPECERKQFIMFLRPCRQLLSLPRFNKKILSVNMSSKDAVADDLEPVFQAKRSLRLKVRKALQDMSSSDRACQDSMIQRIVLEAPWFERCERLCAYISCEPLKEVNTSKIISESLSKSHREDSGRGRKEVYLPRVEDRNSNMRMLKVGDVDDLVTSSMNIREPTWIDANGNKRVDVMEASEPVDIIILPGLAFDKSGHRLGRSGGYYDQFLKTYRNLAKERMWVQPRLIALSYSAQLLADGVIPITPNDVPVDAIVTPDGIIHASNVYAHLL